MDDIRIPSRLIQQFSREMLLLVDPDSLKIVDASKVLLNRLGYTLETLIGKLITDIDSGLSSIVFWEEFRRGNELEVFAAESEFISSNGNKFPVLKNIKHVKVDERHWLVIEIFDNRQAKMDENALSRLLRQLKATLEATGDGILVIDKIGQFINMNRHFTTMWNIPKNVVENGTQEINLWLSNSLADPSVYEEVVNNLDGNTKKDAPFLLELSNEKVFELRVYPQVAGNETEGYVLSFHDITQHIHYEHALIIEREKAVQSSRHKSDFLSNMSHELRTPMNSILGFSQLMELDPELSEGNREYVQEILKAGQHLLELINEVLDLTKVESGKFKLHPEEFDLGQLLQECLTLVGPLGGECSLEMHISHDSDIRVNLDRKRLKQVILNLLSNAIKYNRDRGSVFVTVLLDDNNLSIHIKDTGPGIPTERMAELFKPFNRLDAEQSHIEGTGIGLTLTREIIELMDGRIGVESELGIGSTFTAYLPKGCVVLSAVSEPTTTDNNYTVEESNEKVHQIILHVLVVEDVLVNQIIARKFIEKLGHRVDITANGYEAVEAVRTRHYDLVFMDMQMPEMDGLSATKAIRKLGGRFQEIPIIAMTANATKEDRDACIQSGMNDFVPKPVNMQRLQEVLQIYLKIYHQPEK